MKRCCDGVFSHREKESEREARIQERRLEQDKKKEESKLIKKAARERLRIEQGKKGWWKDFNWVIGVMVEMECDGEWWDAIVIQILPPKAGQPVTQGEDAVHMPETGANVTSSDFNCGAESEDGAILKGQPQGSDMFERKGDEGDGWEAALGYMVDKCQGPSISYPKDWPLNGVYICNEDDRPVDIARKHRVNLERLVRNNKAAYPSLTKTSALKAGTAIKLPLPLDIQIGASPAPPADPLGVGIVLIHYVGGAENETEWVFRCSKRMRPSADKLWNAVAVEAAEEMISVLAPDPGAWKKHCLRVLKRIRKHDKSWPFWEEVDPAKEGLDDYFEIISKPMCLDKVESFLNSGQYETPQQFADDMRLIFENAMAYNPPEHMYHQHAQKMLEIFNEWWTSGHDGNNWGQPYGAASGDVVSHLKPSNILPAPAPIVRKKGKRASMDKDITKGGEKEKPDRDLGSKDAQEGSNGKVTNFLDRRLSRSSKMHLKVLADLFQLIFFK
jgi:hypothetical protein